MDTLIATIHAHAAFAPLIIFAALVASGFCIPINEDAMLFIASVLAANERERAVPIFVAVYAGVYLGDFICFGMGWVVGAKLKLNEKRMAKISAYFERSGFWTLVIGRLIPGGVRSSLFLTAGATKMPVKRFIAIDLVAATLSTTIYCSLYFVYGKDIVDAVQRANGVFLPVAAAAVAVFIGYRLLKGSTPTTRMAWLILRVLGLRYKISVEGAECLDAIKGPVLYLFEHPARHDALFHGAILGARKISPAYLAEGDFVEAPAVQRIFAKKYLGLPRMYGVPSDRGSEAAKGRIEEVLAAATAELRAGVSIALSPSGQVLRADGRTRIGKRHGVAAILRGVEPGGVTVVVAKFDGLFGSLFSRAGDGELPTKEEVRAAFAAFLKGGLLFGRRRPVRVSFSVHDLPTGAEATLAAVNARLEAIFFDKRDPVYTPYRAFGRGRSVESGSGVVN